MTDWADFRLEAFGEPYMVWHDGPDFVAFLERVNADPSGVRKLLLEGLAEGDALAAQAIGEAGMVDLAGELVDTIDHSAGTLRVRIAEALTALSGLQEWSGRIADVLLHGATWGDRLDAAMALAHYLPTPALIDALAHGVQDPEYLVRYHSSNSLLTYAGRAADVAADDTLFTLITDDTNRSQWARAAAQLSAAATESLRSPVARVAAPLAARRRVSPAGANPAGTRAGRPRP
jgi:hypothetical protein